MHQVDKIKVACADGFELGATCYTPEKTPKAALMLAPATGIKQHFYTSFATYLAKQGYAVITYDNRGIGASPAPKLNDPKLSLIEWGRQDMTAILEALRLRFPNTSYHLIGHSAGGQLVGLMSNASALSSMCNIASSSGSLRKMKLPYRFKAQFFMNLYIPWSNLFFGKTQSQWVGMGEPLPKYVAAQWSKWCNGEGYVAVDFGKAIQTHYFDTLTLPALWLHASDDAIANAETVEDMRRVYSQSPATVRTLHPQDWGVKDIGHMGFFSRRRQMLWPQVLTWLSLHVQTSQN